MSRFLKKILVLLLPAAFAIGACSEEEKTIAEYPVFPVPVIDTTPLVKLPGYWRKADSLMKGFPNGIQVYRTVQPFMNKSMNAYCVVFDPKTRVEFVPKTSAVLKKPSMVYAEQSGNRFVCINGGFFSSTSSLSLVQYNNALVSANVKSLNRPYNGKSTAYYPTRGAFGISATGTPEVTWVYGVGAGNGITYSYPAPSPNMLNAAPQPVPSATFPAGGVPWVVNSAIGGSPVLIKDGLIHITSAEELIEVDNNSSRARSAIGYTKEGMVVLLAVEGNNPNGAAGLSLAELAQLMKEMGCVGALNLDGGGSTSMTVNGRLTVKPSDAEGERAVVSTILLKVKPKES
ncbi:phosphodiester glycosidase family protein [Arcticibacter sp. MXS-1]|uniref:phosphodiester glycosidase family protein n=1 Tax=Arcticibacter sp. MXS-1 TaxID=3341726 RepID=UPI0035A83006